MHLRLLVSACCQAGQANKVRPLSQLLRNQVFDRAPLCVGDFCLGRGRTKKTLKRGYRTPNICAVWALEGPFQPWESSFHVSLFFRLQLRLLGQMARSATPSSTSIIQALEIFDFGDDTGCAATAPTLKQVIGEIAAWLDLPENANELLFIKFETFTGTNVRASQRCLVLSCRAGFTAPSLCTLGFPVFPLSTSRTTANCCPPRCSRNALHSSTSSRAIG